GLRQRLRRRRLQLRRRLRRPRGSRAQQPARGGHPRQAAAARARRVFPRLRREDHEEYHPGAKRRVRQRRHAARGFRRQGRHLRIRQLSRDRRAVPRAGGRTRSRTARGDAAQDSAARARARDLRADMAAGLPQRRRSAGQGIGARAHSQLHLFGSLRRPHVDGPMSGHMRHRRPLFVVLALALMFGAGAARAGDPQGQLTWGVHTTLAPTWLDPAETSGIVTPYMVMYALHDAMLKPMPGQALAPSLAESWTSSEDALSYEFVLRKGVKFHNGDEVTAEDVKFSFERYRGAAHKLLKDRVAAIEIADSRHIRFQLKKPWPDFLTYYVGATGAG